MEDIKDTIGRNIRILRKQKGQTLQSLSRQIGITHQQLSRIENGSGTSTSTLERIAAILDVDMITLMEEPVVRTVLLLADIGIQCWKRCFPWICSFGV